MGITADFLDWFVHEITWQERTGVDIHADPTFAAAQTLTCRVVYAQKMVLDTGGQQRMSSVQIYMKDSAGIEIRDKITLPAGMLPASPQLLAVHRQPDDTGTDVEVLFA